MENDPAKNHRLSLTFTDPSTIYLVVSNQFDGNHGLDLGTEGKMRERKKIDTRLQKIHNAMTGKKQSKNRITEFCQLIEKEAERTLTI